jgi:peptide/nickel transport system substrate-binding protein
MMAQFNLLQKSAVSDKRVRQALNYAVNKTALIKQVLKGYGKALPGQPLTKDYFGYNKKVKAYPYNPKKAKQLLKAAGYGPSHPLALTLYGPQGRYVDDKEIVQAITGQLQAVGVNATPQIETWDLYLPQLLSKKLGPMAFWGASTVPDADIWLGAMMTSKGAYSTWDNPKFDKMVQQGGSTLSPSKRRAIYAKAMVYAHDQAPLLYLYQQVDIYGASKRLSGFHASPDEYIGLAGVHLK